MKNFFCLAIILFFSILTSSLRAQSTNDEGRFLARLKSTIVDNDTIRQLQSIKTECENLVSRLKANNRASSALRQSYMKTQENFNSYLALIQSDLQNVNTIGALTEYLVGSRKRKKSYNEKFLRAKTAYIDFVKSAETALKDNQGVTKTLVDWGLGAFIPKVTIPSNIVISKITEVISQTIEEKKFKSWEEIN